MLLPPLGVGVVQPPEEALPARVVVRGAADLPLRERVLALGQQQFALAGHATAAGGVTSGVVAEAVAL